MFDTQYNSTLGEYKYYGGPFSPYNTPQVTTTAIGMMCKVFFGAPPQHAKITTWVAGKTPVRGAVYANFYMTQLLYAHGGSTWNTWKNLMQQHLQTYQENAPGQHIDGSWYWSSADQDNYGGASGGWGHSGWNAAGGEYCTASALLCLEQNFSRLKLGGSFGGGQGGQPCRWWPEGTRPSRSQTTRLISTAQAGEEWRTSPRHGAWSAVLAR